MKTVTISALLTELKLTEWSHVFRGKGTRIRRTNLDSESIPGNMEASLAEVTVTVYGPEALAYVEFLGERVERNEAGRLTAGDLWEAWADHCGTAPGRGDIAGISRQIALRLFKSHFEVSEQTRARIDGRVQRCWVGFRIDPAGS